MSDTDLIERDFGEIETEVEGMTMTCRAAVPGKSLHDLVCIFDEASKSEGTSNVSGNPSTWPIVRGVRAVVNAVLSSLPNATEAADRLTALEAENAELRRERDEARTDFHTAVKNRVAAERRAEAAEAEVARLNEHFNHMEDVEGGLEEMVEENKKLRSEVARLTAPLEGMQTTAEERERWQEHPKLSKEAIEQVLVAGIMGLRDRKIVSDVDGYTHPLAKMYAALPRLLSDLDHALAAARLAGERKATAAETIVLRCVDPFQVPQDLVAQYEAIRARKENPDETD